MGNDVLSEHDKRISAVEESNHNIDKTLAVVIQKLDQVIEDVKTLKDQWPEILTRLETFLGTFVSNYSTKGELNLTNDRITKAEKRICDMESWKSKVDPYGSTPNMLRWIGIIAAVVIVAWPIITAIIISFVVK